MNKTLTEKVRKSCKTLYETGVNDGMNAIVYFPTPVEFHVDKIMALFQEEMEEEMGKVAIRARWRGMEMTLREVKLISPKLAREIKHTLLSPKPISNPKE